MYPLQNQLNVGYVGDMQRIKKKRKEKKVSMKYMMKNEGR